MTSRIYTPPRWSVAIAALVIGASAHGSGARDGQDEDEIPFDVADVLAELNDTDGDLGFHALIDGEAWDLLEIENPNGRRIFVVRPRSALARQGMTEVTFESAEPPFDELPPEAFFERFPDGEYEISGRTIEGDELESTDEFTHLLPAPAGGIMVSDAPIDPEEVDCEDEDTIPAVGEPITIGWEPVELSHPTIGRTGEPIEVVRYQVVVEREEPTPLLYSVDLAPDMREVEVPSGLTGPGEQLKFEILVREESGNQTAIESCFLVE